MAIQTYPEIQDIIEQISTISSGLSGVKSAPKEPPTKASAFPFIVTYPQSGSIDREIGWLLEQHVLVTEIHVARKDLPQDIRNSLTYLRSFTQAYLSDHNLGGYVDNIDDFTYNFGPLDWGDTKTLGWSIVSNVTVRTKMQSITWQPDSGTNNPTLTNLINQIQTLVKDFMVSAPTYAPENLYAFPISVTYPQSGNIVKFDSHYRELHSVVTEFHVARKNLPTDARLAYPLLRKYGATLLNDPTLSQMCTTVNDINYTFGNLGWVSQEVETMGFRFNTEFKINVDG